MDLLIDARLGTATGVMGGVVGVSMGWRVGEGISTSRNKKMVRTVFTPHLHHTIFKISY
jgi:hypothetical protein